MQTELVLYKKWITMYNHYCEDDSVPKLTLVDDGFLYEIKLVSEELHNWVDDYLAVNISSLPKDVLKTLNESLEEMKHFCQQTFELHLKVKRLFQQNLAEAHFKKKYLKISKSKL